MNIIGTRVRSDKFTYNNQTKEFTAEISDLKGFPLFSRVYSDAYDEGFVLVSARTGKEVVFVLAETQRDAEGDIQFWVFEPASRAPKLQGIKVIVLND